jgi:hypothetical protein
MDMLDADAMSEKILMSCHMHTDLDQWDLYRQMLAPVSSISVVSCHDLAQTLAERFGIAVRGWFAVPPEHQYAGMFHPSSAAASEPFYPAMFDRIMENLAPLPGEVFLVAAGFLGKLLCDRIRERGGLALDIGSTADMWLGYATRSETPGAQAFDIAVSLIEGQPFADTFDPQRLSLAEPCRSDRTRRQNLTSRFDALFSEETAAPKSSRYPLRVIGHPRCGSGYVAQILSRLGLELGHEQLGADGLCSWIHTIDDLNRPFKSPYAPARAFRATLAYVRDPVAAIPSIMLENCRSESFAFRRFHIARWLGVDIAQRRNPLERAVESYLKWMELVERQQPLFTLRVERLLDDLAAHENNMAAAGLSLNWALHDAAQAVPMDFNRSADKYSAKKPDITPADYQALPSTLADALAAFCERHGYDLPGASAGSSIISDQPLAPDQPVELLSDLG